jgi:hypothetical protein
MDIREMDLYDRTSVFYYFKRKSYARKVCFSDWGNLVGENIQEITLGVCCQGNKLEPFQEQLLNTPEASRMVKRVTWDEEKQKLSVTLDAQFSQIEILLFATLWRLPFEYHREPVFLPYVSVIDNAVLNRLQGNIERSCHDICPDFWETLPIGATFKDVVEELEKQHPFVPFKEGRYRWWSIHKAMESVKEREHVTEFDNFEDAMRYCEEVKLLEDKE